MTSQFGTEPARELRPIRQLGDLAGVLTGRLILPGDADWDAARAAWQLTADQHPIAIVQAGGRHDLAVTVRAAAGLGLRVAPQATGHNALPLGDLSRTILLRTDALTEVQVDAEAGVAHIGAGARCSDVMAAAHSAGVLAVTGFASDVGIVGFLLGGGLGWFARSHGLAARSITGLDLVTADGALRRVAAGDDLFEAVLAGADIAVVAGVSLRLHPIPDLVAGALFWPVGSAPEVFDAWVRWSAQVPESVTTVVRVLRFPDTPEVPPIFAGQSFVVVEAVVQGSVAAADALLAPLRTLNPQLDTFAVSAPPALAALHGDPPVPVPARGFSAVLGSLSEEVIARLLGAALQGPAAVLTSIELRRLGGALDREASAVAGADALVYAVGVIPVPELAGPVAAGLEAVAEAVGPARTGWDVRTFVEEPSDPARIFGDELARVRAAKRRWDAADLIHAAHSVGARPGTIAA